MTFDREKLRQDLLAFLIDLNRKKTFAEAEQYRCFGRFGGFVLGDSICCFLVGLCDVGGELAAKARTFLWKAIEIKEIQTGYFPGATEASRFENLALANWIVDGRHDDENLKAAVESRELWFSNEKKLDKSEVQFSLPLYLDAEAYGALIKRFEQANIQQPSHLSRIRGEGTMSYVIARQRLGLGSSAAQVEAALKTFLKRKIPEFLGGGHYSSTAHWMKIAFWKPGDDPIATLLKCYDYLPGLEPPKYP